MNRSSKYSNEEILEGILNSNREILQYVYDEYFRTIRRYILTNKGSEEDAEDVFQEALIALYLKLRNPNFRLTSALGTFIYSIGVNIWLNEIRNRHLKHGTTVIKDDETEGLLVLDDTIIASLQHTAKLKLYREKFEELTADCQQVLRLFLSEIPPAQIAEVMGYSSVQHAKNRQYRCKEFLIKKIKRSPIFKKLGHAQNYAD